MAGKPGRRGNQQGGVRRRRGKWCIRYTDAAGQQRQRVTAALSKIASSARRKK